MATLMYSHPTKWLRYHAHIVAPWLRPASEHPDRVTGVIGGGALKGMLLDKTSGRMFTR